MVAAALIISIAALIMSIVALVKTASLRHYWLTMLENALQEVSRMSVDDIRNGRF